MLTVKELKSVDKSKKDIQISIYKYFLDILYKKIKERNKIGIKQMEYKIPLICAGYPLYDTNNVIKYISKKLTEGNFKVYQKTNTSLLIHW